LNPSVCVCVAGTRLENAKCLPICGDGIVLAPEKCDDKEGGGCLKDCSGIAENFECKTEGTETKCSCL
jgi:cysteine-rich repeat protein